MTANGPSTQSFNFTHFFEKNDLRPKFKTAQKLFSPNNMMGILSSSDDFKIVVQIIKLAELDSLLNDCQSNCTLLIPTDYFLKEKYPETVFANMDKSTARNLILGSMLSRKIPSFLLQSSPCSYYQTKSSGYNKLLVTNISDQCIFNNTAKLVAADIDCSNGMIQATDDFVVGTDMIII